MSGKSPAKGQTGKVGDKTAAKRQQSEKEMEGHMKGDAVIGRMSRTLDEIAKEIADDLSDTEDEEGTDKSPGKRSTFVTGTEGMVHREPARMQSGGEYNQKQLEGALQRQMRGAGLPPYEMRLDVIEYARDKSCQMLLDEEYDEASRIDQAVDIIRVSMQSDESQYKDQLEKFSLTKRIEGAAERQQAIIDRWDQEIERFKVQGNAKLGKMEERHQGETILLQEEWSRPGALTPFSKPSSNLLQLKKMQKSLAIVHDYEGAKRLKEESAQLVLQETHIGGERASRSMKAAYAQLVERQKREVDGFLAHCQQQVMRMEGEKEAELRANENLRRRLQVRLSAGLPMNKKPPVTVPVTKAPVRSTTGKISAQTRDRYNTFKKTTEQVRLDIRLADFNSIMKTPDSEKRIKVMIL